MRSLLPVLVSLFLPLSIPRAQGSGQVPSTLSSGDLAALRSVYEAKRFAVRSDAEGHVAGNPAQRLSTRFDGRGFTTRPDEGEWEWGIELVSWGIAGRQDSIEGQARVRVDDQRVVYRWSDDLSEWFVNDRRGLEHGYTVHRRPPGSREEGDDQRPLTLELRVRGELRPRICAGGRDIRFLRADGVAALTYTGLVVFDADGRELEARFEEVGGVLSLEIDEGGARYPLTIDPIVQQAYLKASNTETADLFGTAIAISGNTVVVGAPWEDSSATGINGDDSLNDAANSGAAFVFVRTGSVWTQEAYIKASNTGAGDEFGSEVSVSGDTIVIGTRFEDSNATGIGGSGANDAAPDSGAAYVFQRTGTTWTEQAYLKASNAEAGDRFGDAVWIDADTVVVGASLEASNATGIGGSQSNNSATNAGAVYVYLRTGTTWTQQAYIKASNTNASDFFGEEVALDGDTLVVGASGERSNATGVNGNQANNSLTGAGAAYVFVRVGTSWSQEAYVKASNTEGGAMGGDGFGASVSVSVDTLVVGAPAEDSAATGVGGDQNDNSASTAGAVYVFKRSGTLWAQEAYVKASNTDAADQFGRNQAIRGNTLVVGAFGEDSLATGMGGSQGNTGVGVGAAYLFRRTGTTWVQDAYMKASNAGDNDNFSTSLAISGNTVVVGASGEDSSATGVNGDGSINAAFNSGAAYVFTLDNVATATYRNVVSNPASYTATLPVIGSIWTGTVDLTTTGHDCAVLLGRTQPATIPLGGGQTFLATGGTPLSFAATSGPIANFFAIIPLDPSLCGVALYTQAAHLGGVVPFALSNAMDLVAGI